MDEQGRYLTDKAIMAELRRYRNHSMTLNQVAYRLAQALGTEREDVEGFFGDPRVLVEQLIVERDRLRALIDGLWQCHGDVCWSKGNHSEETS